MTDPSAILKGLSEAQKRALLAFVEPYPGKYATAKELGVSGNTLSSLNGVGDVDPVTFEPGPVLCTYDWWGPTRHWIITEDGLAVRALLDPKS